MDGWGQRQLTPTLLVQAQCLVSNSVTCYTSDLSYICHSVDWAEEIKCSSVTLASVLKSLATVLSVPELRCSLRFQCWETTYWFAILKAHKVKRQRWLTLLSKPVHATGDVYGPTAVDLGLVRPGITLDSILMWVKRRFVHLPCCPYLSHVS